MATFVPKNDDFVIWGPAVSSGLLALNAVYSLYFLPDRFKLIMPPAMPEEKRDYEKIEAFIAQNGLTRRVLFSDKHYTLSRQLIISTNPDDDRPGYIYGSTPEALASAILRVARKQPALIKD